MARPYRKIKIMGYYFTSESVSEGHPDKVADQISDAVLDEMLRQDPESKVACETLVTTGLTVVAGEVKSNGYVDIQGTARRVIAVKLPSAIALVARLPTVLREPLEASVTLLATPSSWSDFVVPPNISRYSRFEIENRTRIGRYCTRETSVPEEVVT